MIFFKKKTGRTYVKCARRFADFRAAYNTINKRKLIKNLRKLVSLEVYKTCKYDVDSHL